MKKAGPCPNEADHTLSPTGYLAWHEWAERKAKTHAQLRCKGCGRFEIWVPKGELRAALSATEHGERRDG